MGWTTSLFKKSAFCLAAMCVGTLAYAGDWEQFMGPQRDGTVEGEILTQWPASGPKVLWDMKLGPGFGGASIKDGVVYILDRDMGKADVLRALNIESGKEQWSFRYDAPGRNSYPGSRSVPTIGEKHVYTVGGFGDVYCVDLKTHKPVWNFNLDKRYAESRHKWGFAQSPLLIGDLLILSPLSPNTPGLIAVDKNTGKTKWESKAFGGDSYSSPMLRTIAGKEGILLITNNQLTFIDPKNGKNIWDYKGYSCKYTIPAPTVLSDGQHIFLTGGYGAGSEMIKVEGSSGKYKINQVFKLPQDGSQLHPAIEHDGFLYVNINENDKLRGKGNRAKGGLACIDPKKGKIVWRTGDTPSFDRGSYIKVGDHFLMIEGEKGSLHLIEANEKSYKEVAQTKVLGGNRIWAPLAFSNGFLVIRDQKQMKCLDLRIKK